MEFHDNLTSVRDWYASYLAAQQQNPNYRWNENEQFVLDQILKLHDLISKLEAEEAAKQAVEVISVGYT